MSEAGPPMRSAPAPGSVLAGKYRVERLLGEGGMGYVLAAMHMHLDERVAMKLLHADVAQNPELVARFLREGKAAIKIRSEHVVRVLDVGTLETSEPYMVMEYLEGSDLEALLARSGPQPFTLIVDYVLQACEALAEAHVQGMVHRDLKPANLFVTQRADGTPLVKVLDFGISKVTGTGGADLGMTKTNVVMGSPRYMSPEQMRSMRQVDARADIWALGTIMHEMLTGAPAFDATTMPELCAAILQDPSPRIRSTRPDAPPGLEAVTLRCLEKEPQSRFQTVAELATALEEFASPSGRTSAARVRGVFQAKGVATADASQRSMPSSNIEMARTETSFGHTGAAKPTRRGITGMIAGGVSLVAIAIAFVTLNHARTPVATASASAQTSASTIPSSAASEDAPPRPAPSTEMPPITPTTSTTVDVASSPSSTIAHSKPDHEKRDVRGRTTISAPATSAAVAAPSASSSNDALFDTRK